MWKVLMIVASILSTTYACSCMPSHPQRKFCRSSFVIRAKVVKGPVSEVPPNAPKDILAKYIERQVYTLRVTKVFKGYNQLRQTIENKSRARSHGRNMRIRLLTPSKIDSCRVWLKKGGIYLLGGNIYQDRLHLNSCSWISKWKEMSRRERKNLKWHYDRNCKCQVRSCYSRRACRSAGKMMCFYDLAAPSYKRECSSKYQYCKLDTFKQSCTWYRTSQYRSCMNKVQESLTTLLK